MKQYRYERRLHWSECDPAGIVFFPNYARWMVEGLNEMFLSMGVDPNGRIDKETTGGLPSVGYAMRFHRPAKLHDMITHEITVEKLGRSSLSFKHRFLRAGECLAEGEDHRVLATHSLVDATVKSKPIPDDLRRLLEQESESAASGER